MKMGPGSDSPAFLSGKKTVLDPQERINEAEQQAEEATRFMASSDPSPTALGDTFTVEDGSHSNINQKQPAEDLSEANDGLMAAPVDASFFDILSAECSQPLGHLVPDGDPSRRPTLGLGTITSPPVNRPWQKALASPSKLRGRDADSASCRVAEFFLQKLPHF